MADTNVTQTTDRLPELTRYRTASYGGMVPSDSGPWVNYGEVVALIAELAQRTEAVRR